MSEYGIEDAEGYRLSKMIEASHLTSLVALALALNEARILHRRPLFVFRFSRPARSL